MFEASEHLNKSNEAENVYEETYFTMDQFKANCTLFYQMLNNSGFNEEE